MKIRYNQDGQVVYFDARELIDKCVEAGLLHMFVLREVTSLIYMEKIKDVGRYRILCIVHFLSQGNRG